MRQHSVISKIIVCAINIAEGTLVRHILYARCEDENCKEHLVFTKISKDILVGYLAVPPKPVSTQHRHLRTTSQQTEL